MGSTRDTHVHRLPHDHEHTHWHMQAAVNAMNNGCDVELTCCGAPATYWQLPDAVAAGLVNETALDASLRRTLPYRFALGALDPVGNSPYDTLDGDNATTPSMINLALGMCATEVTA